MMGDIRIIHVPSDDEPFAVIDKPRFLPSAPLYEGDDSAFTRAAAVYPFLLGVNGKKPCEHGLLHRIDTLTSGLLLVASTQAAYESLSTAQDSGLFVKTYRAVCRQLKGQEQCGFAPLPHDFNIESYIKKRLESEQYHVILCNNSLEIDSILSTNKVDLIIIDKPIKEENDYKELTLKIDKSKLSPR